MYIYFYFIWFSNATISSQLNFTNRHIKTEMAWDKNPQFKKSIKKQAEFTHRTHKLLYKPLKQRTEK